MTIQEQIAELIAQAAPLRELDDEEAERQGLPLLVDKINALRAQEVAAKVAADLAEARAVLDGAQQAQHEAEFVAVAAEVAPTKRGPGRPKKAAE